MRNRRTFAWKRFAKWRHFCPKSILDISDHFAILKFLWLHNHHGIYTAITCLAKSMWCDILYIYGLAFLWLPHPQISCNYRITLNGTWDKHVECTINVCAYYILSLTYNVIIHTLHYWSSNIHVHEHSPNIGTFIYLHDVWKWVNHTVNTPCVWVVAHNLSREETSCLYLSVTQRHSSSAGGYPPRDFTWATRLAMTDTLDLKGTTREVRNV